MFLAVQTLHIELLSVYHLGFSSLKHQADVQRYFSRINIESYSGFDLISLTAK